MIRQYQTHACCQVLKSLKVQKYPVLKPCLTQTHLRRACPSLNCDMYQPEDFAEKQKCIAAITRKCDVHKWLAGWQGDKGENVFFHSATSGLITIGCSSRAHVKARTDARTHAHTLAPNAVRSLAAAVDWKRFPARNVTENEVVDLEAHFLPLLGCTTSCASLRGLPPLRTASAAAATSRATLSRGTATQAVLS